MSDALEVHPTRSRREEPGDGVERVLLPGPLDRSSPRLRRRDANRNLIDGAHSTKRDHQVVDPQQRPPRPQMQVGVNGVITQFPALAVAVAAAVPAEAAARPPGLNARIPISASP